MTARLLPRRLALVQNYVTCQHARFAGWLDAECGDLSREKSIIGEFTYNMGPGGARNTLELVDGGDMKGAATMISSMIRVRVKGKNGKIKWVVARGLISRRAEESAPFRALGK